MIAYEPLPWHDLFTAAAGAAATLAGLIFVAVSLNHEQILKQAALPALAASSVSVLVGLVIVSLLGLAPGQGQPRSRDGNPGPWRAAAGRRDSYDDARHEQRDPADVEDKPAVRRGVLDSADGHRGDLGPGPRWRRSLLGADRDGLRPRGVHLLRMDSADRNTTVTLRAGHAQDLPADEARALAVAIQRAADLVEDSQPSR